MRRLQTSNDERLGLLSFLASVAWAGLRELTLPLANDCCR